MSRGVPAARWPVLIAVAGTSRTKHVLVICRSRSVRRQYERAIPKLGGDLDNVIFRILASEPERGH